MEYNQYLTIDDFYEGSYNDPEKFDAKGPATEYKWKGKMNHLSENVAQKLKSFVRWMTHEDRPYELHDDFLATLTRESYLKFRHMDTHSFPASSPSHHEPYKHQVKKGPQRKAFFSQQQEISDDDEYANAEEQFSTDPEPEEHSPYSVYQSSFHPKMPQKSSLPPNIWETLSESTKQMTIEHNKKVKLNNPTPYPSGRKTKPNPTLGKPTHAPQQVHQHSQDGPTEEPPPGTSTQTLVNKCLAESGIDPYLKIQTHQSYVSARVNQSNHHLIDRGANGGLAGADMRVIHTTPRKTPMMGPFKKGTKRDASVLDHEITPSLLQDISQHSDDSLLQDSISDEYGDFHHRAIQTLNIFCDLPSLPPGEPITHAHLHDSNPAEEDWKSLRPYFGWQSEQVIKDTYQVTSRFGGTIPQHDYLKKHFKSRNPVFNIPRRNESVATDTIFSDTPAINDGSTMAQFFVGRDTLVCDAYGIKSQKQFINTLYDNIRFRGAMTTLITDGGRYEISKKIADLLRSLFIKQYESEPYHQHQNKAEQRYGVVKRYINTLMNLTGTPAHCWLLCMLYVCNLLNATASPALGGLTPLQALTRQVPDISHFLLFSFWEPIYYKVDESEPDHRFPSQSNEKRGHWVGFADNKGDHLTWKSLLMTHTTPSVLIA